jgi:hypothetical protein
VGQVELAQPMENREDAAERSDVFRLRTVEAPQLVRSVAALDAAAQPVAAAGPLRAVVAGPLPVVVAGPLRVAVSQASVHCQR